MKKEAIDPELNDKSYTKSIININNDEIHLKIICKTIYNIFKVPETGEI
jgi:hypothetical protein